MKFTPKRQLRGSRKSRSYGLGNVLLKVCQGVGSVIAGPVGLLCDWASSGIRKSEAKHDAELQMKVDDHKASLSRANAAAASRRRMEEAEHQAELEIKMQTEIKRINAETEQWAKDKEFQRMVDLSKAVVNYRKALTDLQMNTIRSIGSMSIELREKAQNLIRSKTREYMLLQSQAIKEAEGDYERIIENFSDNERIFNIMVDSVQKKQANIVDATTHFIEKLFSDMRGELFAPFIGDGNKKWLRLSMKYEGRKAAFDLVVDKFITWWIGRHFEKLFEDDVPQSVRLKAKGVLSELMDAERSELDDTQIRQKLLKEKEEVLKKLLDREDSMENKLEDVRYLNEVHQRQFEKELKMYENELKGKE